MFDDVWVVITAAGKSQRFIDEGYTTPKSHLWLQSPQGIDASMLQHVRLSIPQDATRIVALLPDNVESPADFDRAPFPILRSRGQADSIYQFVKTINRNNRVLILDCDMILRTKDLNILIKGLEIHDMTVAVTQTFDPNASRVDTVPHPTLFVEKEPISQWGIVGARGFRDAGNLTHALGEVLEASYEPKEIYLSTAMNFYVGNCYAHKITEYADLGTPQRIKQSGWKILNEKS